jgi:transposase
VSIITGVERRRAWSEEQKLELVAAAFGPGGSVAEVSRRADVCTSLLYRWRRALSPPTPAIAFLPAVVDKDVVPLPSQPRARAAITIVLPSGSTVSIDPQASPALVKAALGALR